MKWLLCHFQLLLLTVSASSSSEPVDHSDSTSSEEEYVDGQKVKGQNVLATPAVRRLAMENKVDNSRNSEGFINVPNPLLVLIAHCLILYLRNLFTE